VIDRLFDAVLLRIDADDGDRTLGQAEGDSSTKSAAGAGHENTFQGMLHASRSPKARSVTMDFAGSA
jgi:hypothetical protein